MDEFKQFLIGLLTEARELRNKTTSKQVQTVLDSNVRLLERITMFISNTIKQGGHIDMDKAKSEIKVLAEGTFDGLAGKARQKAPLTVAIIDIANSLEEPGDYKQLDPASVDWSKVSGKAYSMRGKLIPEDVFPTTRIISKGKVREGLFLIRLTKEQMQARPKRTRKVNKE